MLLHRSHLLCIHFHAFHEYLAQLDGILVQLEIKATTLAEYKEVGRP